MQWLVFSSLLNCGTHWFTPHSFILSCGPGWVSTSTQPLATGRRPPGELLQDCKKDCKLELSEDLGFPAGQPQSFTDTIQQKHAKGSGWPRISSKGGLSGKVALRRAGVMQEAFNKCAIANNQSNRHPRRREMAWTAVETLVLVRLPISTYPHRPVQVQTLRGVARAAML